MSSVGLLDRPVEITGKRERKKVERLSISTPDIKKQATLPVGSGKRIGDLEYVEQKLKVRNIIFILL